MAVARVAGAVAVALLAACSSGSSDDSRELTDPAAVAAAVPVATVDVVSGPPSDADSTDADGADGNGDADDETEELGALDPLDIAGEIISEFSLVQGDCFNRFEGLQAGRRLSITARVGCDAPHWGEVYHTFELDAPYPAVYPGDDAVRGYALRICYEQFGAFVGQSYELSVYEIEVFTPNRTNFEHELARYRGVHCWLYTGDEQVTGSAVGTGR